MRWLWMGLWAGAVACSGDGEGGDKGDDDPTGAYTFDSGTLDTASETVDSTRVETGSPTGGTADTATPSSIDDAALGSVVQCDPKGTTVDFELLVLGMAAFGQLDVADSANTPNWNEHHELTSAVRAPGGVALGADGIATGVPGPDWSPGSDSVFTCAGHFGAPEVMSYIARAYDGYGQLLDCVAWGHDGDGMIRGDYLTYNPTPDMQDLAGCRTATVAR